MNRNYRSTKQICDYANEKSTYASSDYRIELKTDKAGDKVLSYTINEPDYTYIKERNRTIDAIVENIIPEHETAILCRTNAEVDFISSALAERDINCTTSKKDFTAENILRSCMSDEYLIDWLSTFMSSDVYANYIRLKTIEENPDVIWFLNNFGNVYWIRSYTEPIFKIRKLMNETLNNPESIHSMLEEIVNILDLNVVIDSNVRYTDGVTAVLELIEAINDSTISEVYCGTVHSVKGLEFEDVIIVGVEGQHFRLTNEDNKNVFYVFRLFIFGFIGFIKFKYF